MQAQPRTLPANAQRTTKGAVLVAPCSRPFGPFVTEQAGVPMISRSTTEETIVCMHVGDGLLVRRGGIPSGLRAPGDEVNEWPAGALDRSRTLGTRHQPCHTPSMPVEVFGIDHVYLTVRDLARSEAFYDRVMPVLGYRKSRSTIAGDPHVHFFTGAPASRCDQRGTERRITTRTRPGSITSAFRRYGAAAGG